MMNKVLGTNTNKSNKNTNRLHEIKNGNTLCKTPTTRPPKKSPNKQRLQKIRFLNILKTAGITFFPNQPHQTGWHHIRSKNSVTPENSPMQKVEKKPSFASHHPLQTKHQKHFTHKACSNL